MKSCPDWYYNKTCEARNGATLSFSVNAFGVAGLRKCQGQTWEGNIDDFWACLRLIYKVI